jgi:hypothetical protein
MLTTDLLIVNTQDAANELFDRRSALYSDRYVSYILEHALFDILFQTNPANGHRPVITDSLWLGLLLT